MSESLKKRAITGMVWNSVQQFGTKIVILITNLVLARLLSPEDFGCIGMLMVFISIANTFIDGGFGVAIIQKSNPTQKDYSTIFFWNLLLSIVLYVVLFVSSPVIARFYSIPLLERVLQVQGWLLILNAFYIIPMNQFVKQLKFKLLACIYIISYSLSAVVSIILAYRGFGVWSLVTNNLLVYFLLISCLWFFNKWRPSLIFSWKSFKDMFGFGSMLLLSNLTNTIYLNIQSLVIGKFYSAKDLGFFTQAKKMEEVPVQTLSTVVQQVTLPVFSEIQHDKEKIKKGLRKSVQSLAYINFPLMILLVIIARPLFILLLTEKWNQSVPYFQVLCFAGLFLSLQNINSNILAAVGMSNLIFRWNVVRKAICLVTIFLGLMFFKIWGMLWAIVLNSIIEYAINANLSKRFSDYKFFEQVRDVLPTLFVSFGVGGIIYLLSGFLFGHIILTLFLQVVLFVLLYLLTTRLLKFEAYYIYYTEISERFFKKKNHDI